MEMAKQKGQQKKMKTLKALLFYTVFIFTANLSTQTVYVTKTGKKYHKESCRYLKNSKKELTLERALAYGYQACLVCKPPKKKGVSTKSNSTTCTKSDTSHKTLQKSVATQCKGRTKSGSKCKCKTKNASGRCYQHQ